MNQFLIVVDQLAAKALVVDQLAAKGLVANQLATKGLRLEKTGSIH